MNNRKTAGKIQLIFTGLVLLLVGLWTCSLTVEVLKLTWLQWSSGVLAALVVYWFMSGGFFYFEIDIADKHIEVKFYNSFPFTREFQMFRIPVSSFIKYEIEGSGLYRRRLILFQMSASQLAKYPPIYITAFSKKDNVELQTFFEGVKSGNSR